MKSTRRLTKFKRTPRTPAACIVFVYVVADAALDSGHAARACPSSAGERSTIARLWPAPWQVLARRHCARSRGRRAARTLMLVASQGVYLRSGACGDSAPGPNRGECASTLPAAARTFGWLGRRPVQGGQGSWSSSIGGALRFGRHAGQGADRPRRAGRHCARKSRRPSLRTRPHRPGRPSRAWRTAVALGRARASGRFHARSRPPRALLRCAASMFDDTWKSRRPASPGRCRERSRTATPARVFDAVGARGGETVDDHGFQALDRHAATRLRGTGRAELADATLASKPSATAAAADAPASPHPKRRHAQAIRRDRGHDRAFDKGTAAASTRPRRGSCTGRSRTSRSRKRAPRACPGAIGWPARPPGGDHRDHQIALAPPARRVIRRQRPPCTATVLAVARQPRCRASRRTHARPRPGSRTSARMRRPRRHRPGPPANASDHVMSNQASTGLLERAAHAVHVQASTPLPAWRASGLEWLRARPRRRPPASGHHHRHDDHAVVVAMVTSPGLTSAPAPTTRTLTGPSVALIVPWR